MKRGAWQKKLTRNRYGQVLLAVILGVTPGCLGAFVVATVPEHFLEEHLWQHVARHRVPRIFLWTLAALVWMWAVSDLWQLDEALRGSPWLMLGLASAVGLVPESGPHLMFVTMYADGLVPFAVLLAGSIVKMVTACCPCWPTPGKISFWSRGSI